MSDKIFIVPQNDLESVEIAKLLKENGYEEGKNLFITNQQWGASWIGLESEIIEAIARCTDRGDMEPDYSVVYGVELKGENPFNNIDHHYYCDKNWDTGEIVYQEDRTKDENGNPKPSSIAQVADILGVELTLDQKFVGANDRAFVEGMQKFGQHIGMPQAQISEKIKEIRMREHEILAEIQGITPEMETQAVEAIAKAKFTESGCMVVEMPHSKCATVTDRIPEQEYDGGLLIVCGDGERDYYGPSEKVAELSQQFGGWSGDVSQEFTFWGSYNVEPNEIVAIIEGRDFSGAAAGDREI